MAAVFSRIPMRVRCATQRDHVFHPEMNYSQAQLDQLDRLTERWVADHLQKGKTSKKDKELVTLEIYVEGKGVTQDYKEAVKWFRLAAQQGNAEAQSFLSVLFSMMAVKASPKTIGVEPGSQIQG